MCHGQIIETHYQIPSCPLTVALIADTHNCPSARIQSSLNQNAPDVICIAGDIILGHIPKHGYKMDESQNAIDLLYACANIAPTYFSFGNHERILAAQDISIIRKTGVTILDNDWIIHNNCAIGGLSPSRVLEYRAFRSSTNTRELYPQPHNAMSDTPPQPNLDWLDSFCSQPGYRILLCHHPEYYPIYLADRNIDLILCGHAHGGQLRYYNPFHKKWEGLYAPGQGFFPRYTSGIIDNRLVVSRGLSNTLLIPRLCNPPEIVYINI